MSKKGKPISREKTFESFHEFEEWRHKNGTKIKVKEVEFDRTDLDKEVKVLFVPLYDKNKIDLYLEVE